MLKAQVEGEWMRTGLLPVVGAKGWAVDVGGLREGCSQRVKQRRRAKRKETDKDESSGLKSKECGLRTG